MPETPIGRPPAFRIPITYTDAELKAYQRVVLDRQILDATSQGWGYWLPLIAMGGVVALCGGLVGVTTGLVSEKEGSFLAVLVFAGFYTGAAAQLWLSKRFSAKAAQVQRRAFLVRVGEASMLLTDRGIFMRSSTARGFYAMSEFERVTQTDELVLLWLRGARPPIAIPIRLLSRSQHEKLLSLFNDPAWAQA